MSRTRFAFEVLPFLRSAHRNKAGKPWSMEDMAVAFRSMHSKPFSRSQVHRYELGKQVPDADMVGNLADLFGVPVSALFSRGTLTSLDAVRSHVTQAGEAP